MIRIHQAGRPGVWVRSLVAAHGGYFGRLERADRTPLPAIEDKSGLPTVPDLRYQLTRIPAGDGVLECRHCHCGVGPPGLGSDRLVQRRCTLMILGPWLDLWADHAGMLSIEPQWTGVQPTDHPGEHEIAWWECEDPV